MKTTRAAPKNTSHKKSHHKSLKSKIRDIERMLKKRTDMDPTVRKQFEEQVEDLNAQVAAKTQQQKLKKIHQRYKGLKFIGMIHFLLFLSLSIVFFLFQNGKRSFVG